jgi:hypothetical protein
MSLQFAQCMAAGPDISCRLQVGFLPSPAVLVRRQAVSSRRRLLQGVMRACAEEVPPPCCDVPLLACAQVSLRAIDPERFAIVNEAAGGEVMEEIEASKAFYEVYDGAVYMFQVRFNVFQEHYNPRTFRQIQVCRVMSLQRITRYDQHKVWQPYMQR